MDKIYQNRHRKDGWEGIFIKKKKQVTSGLSLRKYNIHIYIYIYVCVYYNCHIFTDDSRTFLLKAFKWSNSSISNNSIWQLKLNGIKYCNIYIYSSDPWWCPMKGPKALGPILVNSPNNSNLKPRHLSGNMKGSLLDYIDKIYLYYSIKNTYIKYFWLVTHTHTHTYIYIYNESYCHLVVVTISVQDRRTYYCPLGLGCRIDRLQLCRGLRPPPQRVFWLWH